MRRVSPIAAAKPIPRPSPATAAPCFTTIPRTRPAGAPSAMRTPISCRRCVTP